MIPALGEWLNEVVRDEKPAQEIVAFNIGLFESPEGYCAYLSGAKTYSADDPDWATEESYTPAQRYCVLGDLGGQGWEEVQESVVDSVRSFLDSAPGAGSFLAKAHAVTVGFDDGDLVTVKSA